MRPSLRPGLALPFFVLIALAPVSIAGAPAADGQGQRATTASPQATATLPSGREVIDRHLKAIGGREALLAQTSTHATGTVSLTAAGITGTLEAYHAKPNKFLQRINLPGIGDIEEGFDGKVGWSLSPLTGPTLLDGKLLEERAFDAEFYEDLKPADRYQSITTMEKTTFAERPAYKVRLVKRDGNEDFEYYDTETGLKLGIVTKRESPMGPVEITALVSDYKKFGPLLQPTTMKQTAMMVETNFTITTLEYGNVEASIFTLPAPIKALIK
jgi:hypothetical protein